MTCTRVPLKQRHLSLIRTHGHVPKVSRMKSFHCIQMMHTWNHCSIDPMTEANIHSKHTSVGGGALLYSLTTMNYICCMPRLLTKGNSPVRLLRSVVVLVVTGLEPATVGQE